MKDIDGYLKCEDAGALRALIFKIKAELQSRLTLSSFSQRTGYGHPHNYVDEYLSFKE